MRKFTTIIILLTFVFTWTSIPASIADEGTDTATETDTSAPAAPAAASAATAATTAGISNTLVEGGVFAATVALMAVAIASGSDFEQPQQGHGH
jgi:hypothetical protein